jgi:very-short-patch-repair endonuclease
MSPIEERMLVAFEESCALDESAPQTEAEVRFRDRMLRQQGFDPARALLLFGAGWSLFREHPIGPYRADFALVSLGGFIAVECDGHNFHDRTPDQAAHDRKRDRFFAMRGWLTLRFTGREIRRDAAACVAEVFEVCGEMDGRLIADFEAMNAAVKTGRAVDYTKFVNRSAR